MPAPDQVSVLIPAAGSGARMGLGPKALMPLHGRPVVEWVVDKGRQLGAEVLVACASGMAAPAGSIGIAGGASRQESVLRLARAATRPWCLLWDAASPFASAALARRVLAAAADSGAATTCLPASVPWLELDGARVLRAHPSVSSGSTATPQAYATALLREVVERAERDGWSAQSTVQLVLRSGHGITAVSGEKLNLKLTTPEDWLLAQALHDQLQS